MRVPLSWLRDYVDVDLEPEALAERLTLLGMEVKWIERWGAEWRSVVVGELLTVERHPRADRLSLTTVTVGPGEALHIVCGATNIAPGQRVPVALPGAILPGDRRIERTEKMGVVSEGMLCSGDELQLTTDADGILILPSDTPLGVDLSDLYGDIVLDVDVKPNRGDALSLIGLAREVAAATGATLRHPVIDLTESGAPVAELLSVVVEEPDLCSRFVGRWRERRHDRAVPRPDPDAPPRRRRSGRSATSSTRSNYVMLEMGKPTHTFDAAAVHDGPSSSASRGKGERLETLDHVERVLDGRHARHRGPRGRHRHRRRHGRGGARGLRDTTDVVVESAIFDPVSIRRTGQRYALRSEASLRFEKGQDVPTARLGADRVAQLIVAWAGGAVHPGASTRTRQSPSARASRSARRGSSDSSVPRSRPPSSARCWRGSGSRRPRRTASSPCPSSPAPRPSSSRPIRTRRSSRSSRRGVATSRSRPTSRRRSHASAATRPSRRGRRRPPCRRTGRSPLEVRDAVRERSRARGCPRS